MGCGSVISAIVLATSVMLVSDAARADDCNTPGRSTAERSDYEFQNLKVATAQMTASRARALTAAKTLRAIGVVFDFDPDIRAAQLAWSNWVDKECQLEADATLGSAGAYILPVCKQRLTAERTKELDRLADQLESSK